MLEISLVFQDLTSAPVVILTNTQQAMYGKDTFKPPARLYCLAQNLSTRIFPWYRPKKLQDCWEEQIFHDGSTGLSTAEPTAGCHGVGGEPH